MRRITEVQKAQLAGMWDCDGHIGVTRRWRSGRPYYRPVVQIGQAKRVLLDWIVSVIGGGKVHTYHPDRRANPNRPHMFHLRLPDGMAAWFLREIRSYLVLKRHQADLVIEMCDGMTWNGKLLSDDERARREGIAAELSALNAPVDGVGQYAAGPGSHKLGARNLKIVTQEKAQVA